MQPPKPVARNTHADPLSVTDRARPMLRLAWSNNLRASAPKTHACARCSPKSMQSQRRTKRSDLRVIHQWLRENPQFVEELAAILSDKD